MDDKASDGRKRTSQSYNVKRCTAYPVTDVQTYASRIILGLVDGLLLDEPHPSVFQFLPLVKNERDERAHILKRKCRSRDAALAFVYMALCRKHTTPDEPFDESSRW